jgi:hypothetical protein
MQPAGGAPQPRDKKLTYSLCLTGHDKPIADLPDLEFQADGKPGERPRDGFKEKGDGLPPAPPRDPLLNPAFTPDKRLHLIPEAGLIITIPTGNDRLVLHRFDFRGALERSGVPYLFIASQPVLAARKGETYVYQAVARSDKAQRHYYLKSGPQGMSVSAAGRVTWEVPAHFDETECDVALGVTGGGQKCLQSFTIRLRE